DITEAVVSETGQFTGAEAKMRIQGLRVDWLVPKPTGSIQQWLEGAAAQASRYRGFRELENRRDHVDELHDVGEPLAAAGAAGLLHDEWHVNRFIVDEQAVFLLAVIAEAFTVIREENNRRAIVELVGFQVSDQTTDDFIRIRDFAIVRLVFVIIRRR